MKMKVKVFDIDYDTDKQTAKMLPQTIIIDVADAELEELRDELADYVSDETGFCINGCSYEIVSF